MCKIGSREPDIVTDYYDDIYAVLAGFDGLADMAQGFVDDYNSLCKGIAV